MNRIVASSIPFIAITFLVTAGSAFAQRFTSRSDTDAVKSSVVAGDEKAQEAYLSLKAGNLSDARKFLIEADPSDPFAVFVRAALTPDAVEAADTYREIVAEYPGKPIAQEALLELYKYHYAAGEYAAAHVDYLELQKYPPAMDGIVDPAGFADTLHVPPPVPMPQASAAPASVTPEAGPMVRFTVQLGAFSTSENARNFAASLKNKGIAADIFTKIDGGKTLYAVSTGDFTTREAADAVARRLKERSISCIVVQK